MMVMMMIMMKVTHWNETRLGFVSWIPTHCVPQDPLNHQPCKVQQYIRRYLGTSMASSWFSLFKWPYGDVSKPMESPVDPCSELHQSSGFTEHSPTTGDRYWSIAACQKSRIPRSIHWFIMGFPIKWPELRWISLISDWPTYHVCQLNVACIYHDTIAIMWCIYPLVNIQTAIENGPFIADLPIENGDFP